MKKNLLCVLLLLITYFSYAQKKVKYVDPMIGAGGHGHVFVGASVPFGAVQLGPSNIHKGWDWCSGYHYSDSVIIGFAHTHLSGTGGSDLGDILIMPYTGPVKVKVGTQQSPLSGFASYYSHADEVVKPGYYSLKLKSYNIKAELTATERVGFHQYTFTAGKEAHVMVDLKDGNADRATDTYIKQVDKYTLVGYRFSQGWANDQRLYFAIKSSVPFGRFEVSNDTIPLNTSSGKGNGIKGVISFNTPPSIVKFKVGISPVSYENAIANINSEIPGWDLKKVAKQAEYKWEKELSKIDIQTKNEDDKKIFYTSLYHTMIDPSIFNDHNGDYRGTDKKVYKKAGFTNYTVFSLWDTYRALQPLFTIFQPERENDIINSMLAIYQQQKRLPIWHLQGCETELMPGISGVQVVAEAYLKGFRGFDTQLAYEAVKTSANRDELGLTYQKKLQYIPSDKVQEAVAKAMEYSISDGSIALMAKRTGNTTDAEYFTKRSRNYKYYFDASSGFFRGKRADGTWNPVFKPEKFSHPYINDYTEGNAWQYLWLVPQDVEGLIDIIGGEKAFNSRLDSLFALEVEPDPNMPLDITGLIGQYVHGDEPSHHIAYLYAYTGQQYKTAEKVRYIMKNMYQSTVDGISGNEDCGQMSAWYIFSSLGFYPVFPANGAYVLGSPLFDKATLMLPEGKKFVVTAVNNSPENIYIQNIELNGKSYNKSYLMHKDIMNGGALKITMGNKPSAFGASVDARPKSSY
ncbi:glycoside hydrolase family 92 protein [Mucilaginibacter limnophilus]|uniref:Glycoside hydrolase family 92 protein n=1 Tax=Mucilaginibacter limnophilus TaxID=1932778 RepID=A0A437MTJ4_9SPHI|nr:GH92 family glycosyl hydrolase [Mucilaginibacter limnophilus]RVU00963.1 glycoside hydrolase family 92 protein [Mucilaginibacter limnophilus]